MKPSFNNESNKSKVYLYLSIIHLLTFINELHFKKCMRISDFMSLSVTSIKLKEKNLKIKKASRIRV